MRAGTLLLAFCVAGFVFLYAPIVSLIVFSFNESKLVTVWGGFSTKWYGELLRDPQILGSAWISLQVAVVSATLAVVLGTLAAYVLMRFGRFRSRALLTGMSTAPLVMPEVITGLSLLLLMTVFRSIFVPIAAVLHFLLSLGATYGAVTLVFQEGWFSDIVNPIDVGPVVVLLPIILLAVLFGLSIDYEVFLVSRMREEYLRGTTARESVRRGYLKSARVVSIAAIIITLVMVGEVMQLRAMGATSQAIRQLLELAPANAVRIDAHGEKEIPLSDVQVGDKLRVRVVDADEYDLWAERV